MYKNGEIERVMESFEKSLNKSSIYVGGKVEKAARVEVELPDGKFARRYQNNNFFERMLDAIEVAPEDLRHGVESPAEAALTGLMMLLALAGMMLLVWAVSP